MYIDDLFHRSRSENTISKSGYPTKINIYCKSDDPSEIENRSYMIISFPKYYRNQPESEILDNISTRNHNIAIYSDIVPKECI